MNHQSMGSPQDWGCLVVEVFPLVLLSQMNPMVLSAPCFLTHSIVITDSVSCIFFHGMCAVTHIARAP